jgi:hypothetical protein
MMLVCFGAAWPFSIYQGIVSRSNKGKSLIFLLVVEAGYLSGIIHKIYWAMDRVIWLYILNFVLVAIDVAVFLRNRSLEEREIRNHITSNAP